MKNRAQVGLWCVVFVTASFFSYTKLAVAETPIKWQKFVAVAGQAEPIPEQWLQGEEARIAHSLVLPDGIPRTVPFTFRAGLVSNHRRPSIEYFDHLCQTEAGQWIFRTV